MKRRDSIKTIILSSIGASLTLEGCISPLNENVSEKIWEYRYGRTPYEKDRDKKFLNAQFFNNSELRTIERIANFFFFLFIKNVLFYVNSIVLGKIY